jgi:Protein of unknown function (DUF2786)
MGNRSRPERLITTAPEHLASRLRQSVTSVWQRGWQPADVARLAGRSLEPLHLRLLADAVHTELRTYPSGTIDPGWRPQVDDLDAASAAARLGPFDGDLVYVVLGVRRLITFLDLLPTLEPFGPLPGTLRPGSTGRRPNQAAGVDERMLTRVRAMLAKAEATRYPAEAETFTTAAQALMARHSIDLAMLAATSPPTGDDRPTGRRIGIDNPYEATKASLLDAVASANRCRSVWSRSLGFCTVLGYEADLDAVETLFTSLRVQATAAMTRAGRRTDADGRSRTRSFRQSFLAAYAQRIGERLSAATRGQTDAVAAAPGGENLLPVLASRGRAVDEVVEAMFPGMTTYSNRVTDAEGYRSGRGAADLALLSAGHSLAR